MNNISSYINKIYKSDLIFAILKFGCDFKKLISFLSILTISYIIIYEVFKLIKRYILRCKNKYIPCSDNQQSNRKYMKISSDSCKGCTTSSNVYYNNFNKCNKLNNCDKLYYKDKKKVFNVLKKFKIT